jgi:5'-nucleotidase/UDP-sugar diphosphatase
MINIDNLARCLLLSAIIVIFSLLAGCRTGPEALPSSITILHTNDVHGSLDNAPRVTALIDQARNTVGQDNLLLVDSGDVFSGTLYSTLFQGEAEAWFMDQDHYEAMTLGNHEFDNGSRWLADFIHRLNFPVVDANLSYTDDSPLSHSTQPWIVVDKGGSSYGVFGLTTSQLKDLSSPGPDVTIKNETEAARRAVSDLQKKGLNKIVALTHIGWDEDLALAKQVPGIDIIVGGHSHTVPEVYPTVVYHGNVPTLVVQAGAQNKYLGRLNASFDRQGVIKKWDGSQLIPIDDKIEADPAGAAKIAEYQKSISFYTGTIIGKTVVDLDGERGHVRSQETNLGDLVADSMLDKAAKVQARVALISGGGIRASIPAGDVSLGSAINVLPFNDYLATVDISGSQLMSALENGVSRVEQGDGRFPQVAGLRFTWDPEASPGSRIRSVETRTINGYQPLDPGASYRIVLNNFDAGGGDGYTEFTQGQNAITLGYVDYEVLADYIKSHSPLNPAVEGRIRTVSP